MKLVVFGLSVSSAWGNGHASVLRALFRAFERRGHRVVFFEKDVPYYAAHRDDPSQWGCEVVLVADWAQAMAQARAALDDADAAMMTSYCPDAPLVIDMVFSSRAPLRVFYDLDMPVTLDRLGAGEEVEYVGRRGFSDFDLVLSFTGGEALFVDAHERLGATSVAALWGGVDPDVHRPVPADGPSRDALSYLGTYAHDRRAQVEALFFEVARRLPDERFVLAGPLYPEGERGGENVRHVPHVSPGLHSAFYRSCGLTLNIVRGAMKRYGYCPSGRLFEAAASAAAIVTEPFAGLTDFFEPEREILVADTTDDVLRALARPAAELRLMGERARQRVLAEHSGDARARELEGFLSRSAPRATA